MAQIIFNIADADLQRLLDAYCEEFGWQSDSGLTKGQFTKAGLVTYLKGIVRRVEVRHAVEAAATTIEGNFVSPDVT